jgi:hypothetical protein
MEKIKTKKCVAYSQEDFLFIKLITSFTISLLNNCKKILPVPYTVNGFQNLAKSFVRTLI